MVAKKKVHKQYIITITSRQSLNHYDLAKILQDKLVGSHDVLPEGRDAVIIDKVKLVK